MPKSDNTSEIITRITGVDEGDMTYFAIRGVARDGQREVLMTESAARDLWEKLSGRFSRESLEYQL